MTSSKLGVLIVGGGFTGTLLAVQLLRQDPAFEVGIVDKGNLPGRGLAYSSEYRFHLLNVPAGNMSAFPTDPHHFLVWARSNYQSGVEPRSFLPRAVYGRYVGSLLEDAITSGRRGRFHWFQGNAAGVRRIDGGFVVERDKGRELLAQVVVLATGSFPPENPRIPGLTPESKRFVPFPWSGEALDNLPVHGKILLIGSGLTALDLTISLRSRGFRGPIHILSRHGLIPQRQQLAQPWPAFWNEHCPRTTRQLLRLVREQIEAANKFGCDWRAVIDSLRPMTPQIWRSLTVAERKRFLRHVRPYWEAHRHRVAPEISDIIADLIEEGQVRLSAGHITSYAENDHEAKVAICDRRSRRHKTLHVDRVINCTGSETDSRRIDDPLILSFLHQGLARPDELMLGLDVDDSGALRDYRGAPSPSLYAIGQVRKGCLWETTAVPEIRVQAAELARLLVERVQPGNSRQPSAVSDQHNRIA